MQLQKDVSSNTELQVNAMIHSPCNVWKSIASKWNPSAKTEKKSSSFLPSYSIRFDRSVNPSSRFPLSNFQNCLLRRLRLQIPPPLLTLNATPAEVTERLESTINQTAAADADRINLWHLPLWQLHLSAEPLCVLALDFRLLLQRAGNVDASRGSRSALSKGAFLLLRICVRFVWQAEGDLTNKTPRKFTGFKRTAKCNGRTIRGV